METQPAIQELLFQAVRSKLAPNLSFVHELSELLEISYDSAYRRIRGEKELSLEELKTICFHYKISVDALFNQKSDHVIFSALAIGEGGFDIENWLQSLLAAIKMIHAAKEKEIIYAAKDIPVFYYFEFPEIAAFKIYFWNKALIPASGYENKLLTLEAPENLYETGRQLHPGFRRAHSGRLHPQPIYAHVHARHRTSPVPHHPEKKPGHRASEYVGSLLVRPRTMLAS